MLNMIKRFIAFLLPIVRRAAMEAAVDVLTEAAYPARQTNRFRSYNRIPRTSYSQPPRGYTDLVDFAKRDVEETSRLFDDSDRSEQYHDVIMVAFDVTGPNAQTVHEWLHSQMPRTEEHYVPQGKINLDSWWVANDERYDRSDCDSAVFVNMGMQKEARGFLKRAGLAN